MKKSSQDTLLELEKIREKLLRQIDMGSNKEWLETTRKLFIKAQKCCESLAEQNHAEDIYAPLAKNYYLFSSHYRMRWCNITIYHDADYLSKRLLKEIIAEAEMNQSSRNRISGMFQNLFSENIMRVCIELHPIGNDQLKEQMKSWLREQLVERSRYHPGYWCGGVTQYHLRNDFVELHLTQLEKMIQSCDKLPVLDRQAMVNGEIKVINNAPKPADLSILPEYKDPSSPAYRSRSPLKT